MPSFCNKCATQLKPVFLEDDWRRDRHSWPLFDEETGSKIGRIRPVCESCEPNWFRETKIISNFCELESHHEETLLFMDPVTNLSTGLVSFFGDISDSSALFLAPGQSEWQIATNEKDFQSLLTPILVNADETWSLRLFFRNQDPSEINILQPLLVFQQLIKIVSERKEISSDFLHTHADLQEAGTYRPRWFGLSALNFDADSQAPKPGMSLNSIITYKWTKEDEQARAYRLAEALTPVKPRKTCEWCSRPKKTVAYGTQYSEAPKGMVGLNWQKNRFSAETLCVSCSGLKPMLYGTELEPLENTTIRRREPKKLDWQRGFKAGEYLTQAQAETRRVPTNDLILHKQRLPEIVWGIFMQDLHRDQRDAFIQALWEAGWTNRAISEAANVSLERVRQIILQPRIYRNSLGVPEAPRKPAKIQPVYIEPNAQDLERLLELQPLAQQVRSNSPKFRAEAEEYTKLLAKVHIQDGVTLYRLAKRLGVTHGALRFRLARYGYIESSGQSKSYKKVRDENRVNYEE